MKNIKSLLTNFLSSAIIHCAQSNDPLDIPSSLDEEIIYDEAGPYQKFPSKPPQLEQLLSPISIIAKKQENIKGFRFEMPYSFSTNFHTSCVWSLLHQSGKKMEQQQQDQYAQQMAMMGVQEKQNQFTFVGQYLKGLFTQEQPSPDLILTSRLINNGYLEAILIKRITNNIFGKITTSFPNSNIDMAQVGIELEQECFLQFFKQFFPLQANKYRHTLKYSTGMLSAGFTQKIANWAIAGCEMLYLIERKFPLINYGCTFSYKQNNLYMQYVGAMDTYNFSFQHFLKKNAFLFSDLTVQPMKGETSTTIGYRQKFSTSEIITSVNSKYKFNTILTLLGSTYQLKLCSTANYLKNTFKFGYGISIGQAQ